MLSFLFRTIVKRKIDLLLFFVLLMTGIALCHRALEPGMLMGLDSAGHYLKAKFLIEELIPRGKIDGWFPYWHLGFQLFQFYPPGFYIFTAAIHYCSFGFISPLYSFKTAAVLAFALIAATVFYMMKMFGYSREASFVSGLLVLFAGNWYGGGVVGTFKTGLVPNSFGLMLVPLALGLFYKALSEKKEKNTLLAGLSLGFIVLSHAFSAILAIVLSVLLLISFFIKQKEFRKNSILFLEVMATGAMVSLWWWAPAIAKFSEHGILGQWATPSIGSFVKGILNGSTTGSILVTYLCFAGIITALYRRKLPDLFIVLSLGVLFFASAGFLRVGPSEQTLLGSTQYTRFFGALAIFSAIAAGIFFDFLFSTAKKASKKEPVVKAGIMVMVGVLLLFFHSGDFYNQKNRIPLEKDFSAISAIRNAAVWLKENTSNAGVIANEFNWGEWEYGTPHALDQLIPIIAQRRVLGGNFSEGAKTTRSIQFVPERMNGESALTAARLHSLGVTAIVTYSEKAGKGFEKNKNYKKAFQDKSVRIFRFNRKAQAISVNENAEVISHTEKNNGEITAEIKALGDSTVTLPVNYYPNWVATVNGKKASVGRNKDNLVQISTKKGENHLKLVFRPQPWEVALGLISLASTVAIIARILGAKKPRLKTTGHWF